MMDLKYTVDVKKFGKRDCPVCGRWLPRSANRCPHCGHVFPTPKPCSTWVGWVLLGFIVWALIQAALH